VEAVSTSESGQSLPDYKVQHPRKQSFLLRKIVGCSYFPSIFEEGGNFNDKIWEPLK
jgi:hypothetical protein